MANKGIGSLKNSLWACDGIGVKIWMDIWSDEETTSNWHDDVLLAAPKEALRIKLGFYPLGGLNLFRFFFIPDLYLFKYCYIIQPFSSRKELLLELNNK